MARFNIILIILTISLNCFSTTWEPAYPYKQHMEGQKVMVDAIPYDPYSGSPMIGLTKIYYKNRLLYTIDKYYREKIFTSEDGHYFAVVHTSNIEGVSSYTQFGIEKIDYNQAAIEIFKDGVLYKVFSLKNVIDTLNLSNNGRFFNWGYTMDFEAFEMAEFDCKSCKEIYGRRILKTCDSNDIYPEECEECKRACDSVKLKKKALKIYQNSIYVQNNALYILTNQGFVVKLDFKNMDIQKFTFDNIVSNKYFFNPPKLIRKYNKVILPDKFDEPNLINGQSFDIAVACFFEKEISKYNEKNIFTVYVNYLIINKNGRCIEFYGNVYDDRISEYMTNDSRNSEMSEKLKQWVTNQTFQTNLIPKGFDKYSFLCIVHLR